jgi:uncharacterized membrane-anchored protein
MKLNFALRISLFLMGVVLTVIGACKYRTDGSLTLNSRVFLGSGLALILAILIDTKRRRRRASGKARFPHQDEYSRKLNQRAGYIAFHLSIFLWMAIFLFEDLFPESQVMLGAGILGMCVLYGLCILALKQRGIDDENSY